MTNLKRWIALSLFVLTPVSGQFKKVLTNEDLTAMVKSGTDESGLRRTIEESEVSFDTSADALIALRNAGLSEEGVLVVLSAAGRNVTESVAIPGAGALPAEVGVYLMRGDQHVALGPEIFKWKEPGPAWLSRLENTADRILPTARTSRISGDDSVSPSWEQLNATVPGLNSQEAVESGSEFLIVCREQEVAHDYRLVRLNKKSKGRDFSVNLFYLRDNIFGLRPLSEIGVLFGWPGGKFLIGFEVNKVSAHTHKAKLPELKKGHYGFLAPGMPAVGAVGKVYTFEIR